MKRMHNIKITILILFLCGMLSPLCAQQAAKRLAYRILGKKTSARFEFVVCDTGSTDYFLLESRGKKISITANNDISLCMGLNYYLKHYAKVHISWYLPSEPVRAGSLPCIEQAVYKRAKVKNRF